MFSYISLHYAVYFVKGDLNVVAKMTKPYNIYYRRNFKFVTVIINMITSLCLSSLNSESYTEFFHALLKLSRILTFNPIYKICHVNPIITSYVKLIFEKNFPVKSKESFRWCWCGILISVTYVMSSFYVHFLPEKI